MTTLRLVAAVLTVLLVLVLGSLGSDDDREPTYTRYVSLGDSYTAAPFVPVNDIAGGCYRSTNNYPAQVARSLGVREHVDRSCSGARTLDLTASQRTARGTRVPPQLDALTPQTDLVTLGIGANNHRLYARLATVCRTSTTGCPLDDQRVLFSQILDRLRPALVATLTEVQQRSPRARVVLVGYPRLLPPDGDCARLPRMRPQDRATFRDVNLRLVEEMADAAADAGVEYADFYSASRGHDICSSRPWVQGRVGDGRVAAALHPTPAGQDALADLLAQMLSRPSTEG